MEGQLSKTAANYLQETHIEGEDIQRSDLGVRQQEAVHISTNKNLQHGDFLQYD